MVGEQLRWRFASVVCRRGSRRVVCRGARCQRVRALGIRGNVSQVIWGREVIDEIITLCMVGFHSIVYNTIVQRRPNAMLKTKCQHDSRKPPLLCAKPRWEMSGIFIQLFVFVPLSRSHFETSSFRLRSN